MRTCSLCLEDKPRSDFSPDRRSKDGLQARCKPCKSGEQKQHYSNNRVRVRAVGAAYRKSRRYLNTWLRRQYDISADDLDKMLLEQSGRCGACGDPLADMCIDHSHETERVRGLLCRFCNVAIGLLKDDPAVVAGALEYLNGRK